MADRMSGYRPLRPGRIHLRCPRCGRKQSNTPRREWDPADAVLAETGCLKCGQGGKDNETCYFAADGQEIDPWGEEASNG